MLRVIELFGLPGAGKTTIANAAARAPDVLTRKSLSAKWAEQSIVGQAAHVARGITDLNQLLWTARLAYHAPLINLESILHLMRVLAKSHWLRSREGILLLDQGFLQDLWSVLHSANCDDPDLGILAGLVKALYRDTETKIVFVDVDPQTAAGRITGRTHGHSRFDELCGTDLVEALSRATKLQARIVEACNVAGLALETVDGSKSSVSLARQMRVHLRPHNSCCDEPIGILAS